MAQRRPPIDYFRQEFRRQKGFFCVSLQYTKRELVRIKEPTRTSRTQLLGRWLRFASGSASLSSLQHHFHQKSADRIPVEIGSQLWQKVPWPTSMDNFQASLNSPEMINAQWLGLEHFFAFFHTAELDATVMAKIGLATLTSRIVADVRSCTNTLRNCPRPLSCYSSSYRSSWTLWGFLELSETVFGPNMGKFGSLVWVC